MSSLYVPPSLSSSSASPAADGTWNVFSSHKKFTPRAEFAEDAARAFGRRQDNDMPSPFSDSAAGARGGRGGHYDTSAFGNRSGGSSVFTDDAANAFGKRAIKKHAESEQCAPREQMIRPNSIGAHLVALGIDFSDKKEWKRSALPRVGSALASTLTKEEMFPALGTPNGAKEEMFPALGTPNGSPSIPKSESKGSFKDILKKRAEQDAVGETQRRAEEQKKSKAAALEATYMTSLAARIKYRRENAAAAAAATSGDCEEEGGPHYEDDLDALVQYDKPQRNYFHHRPEDGYSDQLGCEEPEEEQDEI